MAEDINRIYIRDEVEKKLKGDQIDQRLIGMWDLIGDKVFYIAPKGSEKPSISTMFSIDHIAYKLMRQIICVNVNTTSIEVREIQGTGYQSIMSYDPKICTFVLSNGSRFAAMVIKDSEQNAIKVDFWELVN